MRSVRIALLALILLLPACTGGGAEDTTTSTEATTTTAAAGTTTTAPSTTTTIAPPDGAGIAGLPRALPAFAAFEAIPLRSEPSPALDFDLPSNLDGVLMPEWLELEPDTAAKLLTDGAAIEPAGFLQFQHAYASYMYGGETFFVTTDVGYHFMHLAFSKALRDLEQYTLLPILEDVVSGLVTATRAQRDELASTALADQADRAAQYAEAAAGLLGLDVGPIGPLAQEEIALALAATELTESPTVGVGECNPLVSVASCTDYSQFKPRGHYTRNADLERYFRAMSLLGQAAFPVEEPEAIQVGALVSRALLSDPSLEEGWRLIYEPTAFLVGMADDYTPQELAAAADTAAPGWQADPTLLTTAAAEQGAAALIATRAVGIDPEAASVRIMGARFVIDSFVFDQLRYPNVGEPDHMRTYTSPLDLVAALDSSLAYRILEEQDLTDYLHFDEQLDLMREMLADRTADDWAATVYDAWLYALEPVWVDHDEAYPPFMQTDTWAAKDLQSGLGSYAELKHDTILYAKQSFAAEGGFEPPEVAPRHWVEPNPVAFERMAAAVGLLQDGLTDRGLIDPVDDMSSMLDDVGTMLARFGRIADDELAGLPISEEDNAWLEAIGSILEGLWVETSDWDPDLGAPSADDTDAAIVADIMRSSFAYLEIGTGRIDRLYVLVPNDAGQMQLAVGGVYSYYEFWRDEELGRLNDDEWRELLDTDPPDRPAWQDAFLTATVESRPSGAPLCADLADDGYDYALAVGYWVEDGRPDRMDADGNGIPCETVYPAAEIDAFYAPAPATAGLFCRDVVAAGGDYAAAVAYWLLEGAPNRMDADGNGIPCETVYDAGEIAGFYP